MPWTPTAPGCWAREDGYRIAVYRQAQGFMYCAYAPPLAERDFDAALRTQYAKGEPVPQRRLHLECYEDAAAARAACDEHDRRVVA